MTKKQKEIPVITEFPELIEPIEIEINTEMDTEIELERNLLLIADDNAWMSDIDKNSLKKALECGVILPNFRPYKNTVYKIRIMSKPRKVVVIEKEKEFFVVDIEKDGMRFSMNMNNSFKFQLALILERYKLTFDELIGKSFHISKDDTGFFNIQLLM